MAKRSSFTLEDAVFLVLMLLLPVMLPVGAAETGPSVRPGLLFWLLLLVPILFLPWLLWPKPSDSTPAANIGSQSDTAGSSAAAHEFATTVTPALDVRRAYLLAGVGYHRHL